MPNATIRKIPGDSNTMRFGCEVILPEGLSLDRKDRVLSNIAINAVDRFGYQGWYVAERTKFYFGNQSFYDTFVEIVEAN